MLCVKKEKIKKQIKNLDIQGKIGQDNVIFERISNFKKLSNSLAPSI